MRVDIVPSGFLGPRKRTTQSNGNPVSFAEAHRYVSISSVAASAWGRNMLVFVGCNYERLPFPDYRDVFREVQNAEPRVRFFFADARITNQSIMQKVRENILSCDLG